MPEQKKIQKIPKWIKWKNLRLGFKPKFTN